MIDGKPEWMVNLGVFDNEYAKGSLRDFADRLGIYTEQCCPFCDHFETPLPEMMQVHITVQHTIAPGDQSPIRCAMQRGARIIAETIWRNCEPAVLEAVAKAINPGGWTD